MNAKQTNLEKGRLAHAILEKAGVTNNNSRAWAGHYRSLLRVPFATLQVVAAAAGIEPASAHALSKSERELLASAGGKIPAIKSIRDRTGMGLHEAYLLVQAYLDEEPGS